MDIFRIQPTTTPLVKGHVTATAILHSFLCTHVWCHVFVVIIMLYKYSIFIAREINMIMSFEFIVFTILELWFFVILRLLYF